MQSEIFPIMTQVLATICFAVWVYLLVGRGWFWLGPVRDTAEFAGRPDRWPAVVAVIPARNESEVIASSVQSLLQQEYPGPLAIIVVDDDSGDDTAAVAKHTATAVPNRQLTVIAGKGPSGGW